MSRLLTLFLAAAALAGCGVLKRGTERPVPDKGDEIAARPAGNAQRAAAGTPRI